jgi:hypothetical protein
MISVSPAVLSAVTERLERGLASAQELGLALHASQTTVSKALRRLEQSGRVLRIGATRGARYALRRSVALIGSSWPLYRIDEQGRPHELATLHALARQEYFTAGSPDRLRGVAHGLPYFLEGSRPAGFIGRTVPAAYPELALPARIDQWLDDHLLTYLTLRGADTPGDLILGNDALDRYLEGVRAPRLTAAADRSSQYPASAGAALRGGLPGSSAQGEQPKFTSTITDGDRSVDVLVKFSPPVTSELGRRWADLLIAEHAAHQVLAAQGTHACVSSIFESEDCVFLECERFDRVAGVGRRGVVTLFALDCARYGQLDSWTACAARLARDGLIAQQVATQITFLDAFGALTANTDRHFGNVSLFERYEGLLDLAPAYDTLPMLFAPHDGRIMQRDFVPPVPQAAWTPVWAQAYETAEVYWQRLVGDARLSPSFRHECTRCLDSLRHMPSPLRPAQRT